MSDDDTPQPPLSGEPEADPAIEIARLAKLSRIDYDKRAKPRPKRWVYAPARSTRK